MASPPNKQSQRAEHPNLAALGAVSSEDDLAAWSADERDALRWRLVKWRDEGRVSDAIAALNAAADQWPEEPIFLLELIVLKAFEAELRLDARIARAPEAVLRHPEIALLMADQDMARGDLDAARRRFEDVGELPAERLAPFADVHERVLQGAVLEPIRAAYVEAAAGSRDPLATDAAAKLVAALGWSFFHADRRGGLDHLVRGVAYLNSMAIPMSLHIAMAALERARRRMSFEGKVVELELLLATYLDGDRFKALVRDLLADDASRRSARFARVVAIAAARQKDGALERQILARFVAPDRPHSQWEAAVVAEVEGRRRARRLDRPARVFVGLFGQLRDPEVVLPKLVSAIQTAFADQRYGDFDLHFGISTWPRTGGRTLKLEDMAGFYAQAAPPAVRPLLTSDQGANGHALAARTPNLIAALIHHSVTRASRDVTMDEIAGYLPDGADIIVTPEEDVEVEVRPGLARVGRDDMATMNQCKMWSRIGALKAAMEAQEARIGGLMDVVLLIRADLRVTEGSLTDLAARAMSPWENSSIFYDYDPHAEFVGGAGDRYMLGARDSIAELLSGYEHYLNAIRSEPPAALAERLVAHVGVQSLMVRGGLTPAPVWALWKEIHRGVASEHAVAEALRSDLAVTRDTILSDAIAAALDRLGGSAVPKPN